MKKRWGVVVAGVLLVGVLTGVSYGKRPGGIDGYGAGPGHAGFDMKLPLLVKAAGLTEAQQVQVRQIVQSHRPQFQGLVSQLRAAHTQLADKLYGPAPVKAEDLAPLTQQIAQLRGQLAQEGLQVALEIRSVLTPEQLAKAAQVRQRFNELRAEMRGLLGAGQ